MPLEHGLPTGPLASRPRRAAGGPVDNPAAFLMHTHPSSPPFRLIPELEWTPGTGIALPALSKCAQAR